MNTRKGLGRGLGCGYKNIAPMDAHIHSLSAKGVVTYKKTKSGGEVRIGTNKDGTKNYLFFPTSAYGKERPHQIRTVLKKIGLNARGSMHTIQLDPEHSVITYSEGTRNGFRHVAILMHNGYEQEKASVSYLNRTWESYEFQTVLNRLFEKAFDKTKAKILMEDLDKKGGQSLMAKGSKRVYHVFTDSKDTYFDTLKDAKKQVKRWEQDGFANLRIYSEDKYGEDEELEYAKGEFPQ
jgi:hypothetical protein